MPDLASVPNVGEEAARTGQFTRLQIQPTPWMLIVILLLAGGGGGTVLGGVIGRSGADAEDQIRAVESDLHAQIIATESRLEARLAISEQKQGADSRMLRDQNRLLLWLVDSSQRQSDAIGSLARAQGVEVDLATPPLLPATVIETSP